MCGFFISEMCYSSDISFEMEEIGMAKILLLILFAGELFFLIWNGKEHKYHDKEKMIYRFGMAAVLGLLVLVGVLEGMWRYGLLIVLLLVQGFLLLRRYRKAEQQTIRMGRQTAGLLGAMLLFTNALLLALLVPQYRALPVTGDHEVGTKTYTWVDESRVETYTDTGESRAVTLKIWYPEEAGSYPLVVFSHGAGGMLESNASACRELASNGYVAVSVAHPYQAAYVKDVNGKVTVVDMEFMNQVMTDNGSADPEHDAEVYELQKEWMSIRTGDENFVLDTILDRAANGGEAPFDRIDTERIGLFGHSLGGATSVAVGRQRTDIGAVIDIEGTMLGEYTGYEEGRLLYCEAPYPVPLLDINSRAVHEQAESMKESGTEYVNFYVGERAADYEEIVIEDAGHMNFCDLALVCPAAAKLLGTGSVDARKCLVNLNEIVLNYFNCYLKDMQ